MTKGTADMVKCKTDYLLHILGERDIGVVVNNRKVETYYR